MPTAAHYKRSAAECGRLATQAQDEIERESLLTMAFQWDRLAEHKAEREHTPSRGSLRAEISCHQDHRNCKMTKT